MKDFPFHTIFCEKNNGKTFKNAKIDSRTVSREEEWSIFITKQKVQEYFEYFSLHTYYQRRGELLNHRLSTQQCFGSSSWLESAIIKI